MRFPTFTELYASRNGDDALGFRKTLKRMGASKSDIEMLMISLKESNDT